MQVPTYSYDVNMTPDKRDLLFHDDGKKIRRVVKRMAARLYSLPEEIDGFLVQQRLSSSQKEKSKEARKDIILDNEDDEEETFLEDLGGRGDVSPSSAESQSTRAYSPPGVLRQKLLDVSPRSHQGSGSEREWGTSAREDSSAGESGGVRSQRATPMDLEEGNGNGGVAGPSKERIAELQRAQHFEPPQRADPDFRAEEEVPMLPPLAGKAPRPMRDEFPAPKAMRREVTELAGPRMGAEGGLPGQPREKVRKTAEEDSVASAQSNSPQQEEESALGGDGRDIEMEVDLGAIRLKIATYEDCARRMETMSQEAFGGEESRLELAGKLFKPGMFLVRLKRDLYLLNATRLSERLLLERMLREGRLLPEQPLEPALPVKEDECQSSESWALLAHPLRPDVARHLRNNGFKVEVAEGGAVSLEAVTPAIRGYGLADLYEFLELLDGHLRDDGASSGPPPHPKRVRVFFAQEATKEADKAPTPEAAEHMLMVCTGDLEEICPHGRQVYQHVARIPVLQPTSAPPVHAGLED